MDSDNYKQDQPVMPYASLLENKSNGMQKSHLPTHKKWIYYIEERRREVAQMLAQGHTETEIAQILHVHVSTISRDVKVLKQLSQRFVFDLAKGDLAYYYKLYVWMALMRLEKRLGVYTNMDTGVKEFIFQSRKS
jgi:predicted transcriptional regulator